MIDRGADHREADRDVHPGLETQHFDRAMALIVIHGHHHVVIPPAGEEEQRVGRQGPAHVPALGAAGLDRRRDLLGLLAMAEQAVLAGMRVDGTDADLRLSNAGLHQHRMPAGDDALDEAGLDPRDRVDQADMGRDVNHPELRGDQHHRHFRRPGEVRQHLGVAGKLVAGRVQRLLRQGRGADALRLSRLHDLHGRRDAAIGGLAGDRGQLPERQVLGDAFQVDALDRIRAEGRRARVGERIDPDRGPDDAARLPQAPGIADHQRLADRVDLRVRQRLHDDLWPDASGIAHGDGDGRTGHVRLPSVRTWRRRSRMRTRLSASPKAPAFVAIGIASCPKVRPSETPGSISSVSWMPWT
ncbi:MAG: hypothetical protein K0Q54_2655 [Methylobacterium brachiatum]|nr:hypothetical protein [Methylobacterium brachiatum]